MIKYRIFSTFECQEFIKRDENKLLEFKVPIGEYKITLSKNLENYLEEFKADPLRYNYDPFYIAECFEKVKSVINGFDFTVNIYLLPEMFSIVDAINNYEGNHIYSIVFFASIIPKRNDSLLWLIAHEIGHSVQNEMLGIIRDPTKVWVEREHEKFANLFAEMILKRI